MYWPLKMVVHKLGLSCFLMILSIGYVAGVCQYNLTAQEGDIKSPGYPKRITERVPGCTWNIRVKPGQRIRLTLKEREVRCNIGSLVLDLHRRNKEQLCHGWVDTSIEGDEFISAANEASVYYKKYPSEPQKGFWISYKAEGCTESDLPSHMEPVDRYPVYWPGIVVWMKCKNGYKWDWAWRVQHVYECINNKWKLIADFGDYCIPDQTCQTLPPPKNGRIRNTTNSVGVQVTYLCNDGYSLDGGNKVRTCKSDGSWSGSAPTCKPKTCRPLETPKNCNVSYTYQQSTPVKATFKCDTGFGLRGNDTRECVRGAWTGSQPVCLRKCPRVSDPEDGMVDHIRGDLLAGDSVNYSCSTGYKLVGDAVHVCGEEGKWIGSPPRCEVVTCSRDDLHNITNGEMTVRARSDGLIRVGSTVEYRCNRGFKFSGTYLRFCRVTGKWSDATYGPPKCTRIKCSVPRSPSHGTVKLVETTNADGKQTRVFNFTCDPGYKMHGLPQLNCSDEGIWQGMTPVCLSKRCKRPPEKILHARVAKYESVRLGVKLVFHCDPGYFFDADLKVQNMTYVCGDDGWDKDMTGCKYTYPTTTNAPTTTETTTQQTTVATTTLPVTTSEKITTTTPTTTTSQSPTTIVSTSTSAFPMIPVSNSTTSSHRSTTNTNTASPVTKTTASPVTKSNTAAPVTNTNTASPATNTNTASPATNTNTAAPVTNTNTASPATNTNTASPATNTNTASPAIHSNTASLETKTNTTSSTFTSPALNNTEPSKATDTLTPSGRQQTSNPSVVDQDGRAEFQKRDGNGKSDSSLSLIIGATIGGLLLAVAILATAIVVTKRRARPPSGAHRFENPDEGEKDIKVDVGRQSVMFSKKGDDWRANPTFRDTDEIIYDEGGVAGVDYDDENVYSNPRSIQDVQI